jgi:hypothetical protein
VKRFVLHFNMKSRDDLSEGEKKIETYLTFLARDRNVAPSTQNQALNALVFLYKHVLKQPLNEKINAERAARKVKIPVVADHWCADRNSSACCQTVVRFWVTHHRVPEAEGA